MNRSVRVIIAPVLLLVCVAILYTTTHRLVDGGPRVISGQTQSETRYSTSDEMRYILYGVGDHEFSADDDPQLLSYIRTHISQPSLTRPRQLATPQKKDASQVGQSAFVDDLLSGRRGGFFVECGAADGETFSNSLFFELERNWTGLLIEANPDYHRTLLDKNRRAYVLRTCLSTEPRPSTVRMLPAGVLSGITNNIHRSHLSYIGDYQKVKPAEVTVNCFPLNAIMAAVGVFHVDYLSLDVEGAELEILRTVDWNRLQIDVITVEYRIYGGAKMGNDVPATLKRLRELRKLFRQTGVYREVAVLPAGTGRDADGLDIVLVRI